MWCYKNTWWFLTNETCMVHLIESVDSEILSTRETHHPWHCHLCGTCYKNTWWPWDIVWCICESIDSEILVTKQFYHGSHHWDLNHYPGHCVVLQEYMVVPITMRHAWCICESVDSERLVTREFYHGSH
jgi:hypothetical protein